MKKPVSLSKLYIAGVRRLHFLVPMAVLVPFFCRITTLGLDADEVAAAAATFVPLYGLTLTLVLPAIAIYLVQEKVSSLWVFLLCACPIALLYLAGLFACEDALGLSINGSEKIAQALILLAFFLDAIQMRTNDNGRKKAKNENDISWRGDEYLLPLPALQFLILFVLFYVGALLFHSHELAHVALTGSILYFFLVFPYLLLYRKEDYLEDRHNVHRIPSELIARLQGRSLLKVLTPCALFAAAAVMTSSGRQFLTLPKITYSGSDGPMYSPFLMRYWLRNEMFEMELFKKGAPPPKWLTEIFYFLDNVMTLLVLALAAYALYRGIRALVIRFGYSYAAPKVSPPAALAADEHTSLKKQRSKRTPLQPQNSVRRRYKKTILRYRGESPDISETPQRMEALAGLPDTPQMRALHRDYEIARYAKEHD